MLSFDVDLPWPAAPSFLHWLSHVSRRAFARR